MILAEVICGHFEQMKTDQLVWSKPVKQANNFVTFFKSELAGKSGDAIENPEILSPPPPPQRSRSQCTYMEISL